MRRPNLRIPSLLLASLLAASCGGEIVPDAFQPTDAHDEYRRGLEDAGLADTALGHDWLAAAREAVEEPLDVDVPFREAGYFDPEEAQAVGYGFTALRGQRIEAELTLHADPEGRIFIDLFRLPEREGDEPVHVATADVARQRLAFEPREEARYVLRLQPELLRGGSYEVTIVADASLSFPVEGRDSTAIQSVFGAARDAGARSHHGVDIFAPRDTAVLAATDGVVRRVDETPRGGKVIWMRDAERSLTFYYAHLESQEATEGQRVAAGETIGRVGNSGNARTTSPHLHFGIYARGEGPVDPYPFLHESRIEPPQVAVDIDRLGSWTRTRIGDAALRERPASRSDSRGLLPRHTPIRLMAGSGEYWRTRLPDGSGGYVAAVQVETLDEPLEVETLDTEKRLLSQPRLVAPVIEVLEAGARLPVLGRFNGYQWVQAPAGRAGWVQPDVP